MTVLILGEVSALGPRCQWEGWLALHCSMTSITEWGDTAMKNQSRNGDKILLAEITVILKHQPRGHEKETKSPFLCNKSGEKKRTFVLALILCLCALQLSNMSLSLEGDWPVHYFACVCHLVIMDDASLSPEARDFWNYYELHWYTCISSWLARIIYFFPYTSVFTGESYILTI